MIRISAILLLAFSIHAASFTWTIPTDPDVTGFKIYVGTNSGIYQTNFLVGLTNFVTIANSNLFVGVTNYAAIRWVNSFGIESDPSEIAFRAPSKITGFRLSLETSDQPIGPWREVTSLAYSDAALTNRFYRGKIYLQ